MRPLPTKITTHDARAANLRTALQAVATRSPLSRADIARLTGLTRATVSSLVGELIDGGYLAEVGQGESAGGKPPTLLSLNGAGRMTVALDVGRQPMEGALVDLAGTVRTRLTGPGHAITGDAALAALVDLGSRLAGTAPAPLLGVGVGAPGVIDAAGNVIEASRLDWHRRPVKAVLEEALGHPVSVSNDARVSALAHFRRGRPQTGSLVLVKIGRGVGAGALVDGKLLDGDHHAAGEIGHVTVEPGGQLCSCGNRGCLETVVSTPALSAALAGSGGLDGPGRALGAALAPVAAMLDIGTFALAVEPPEAAEGLATSVAAELGRRIPARVAGPFEVRVADPTDLVLLGAADLVLRDRLGVVLA